MYKEYIKLIYTLRIEQLCDIYIEIKWGINKAITQYTTTILKWLLVVAFPHSKSKKYNKGQFFGFFGLYIVPLVVIF